MAITTNRDIPRSETRAEMLRAFGELVRGSLIVGVVVIVIVNVFLIIVDRPPGVGRHIIGGSAGYIIRNTRYILRGVRYHRHRHALRKSTVAARKTTPAAC
jgi:hypothetical protein